MPLPRARLSTLPQACVARCLKKALRHRRSSNKRTFKTVLKPTRRKAEAGGAVLTGGTRVTSVRPRRRSCPSKTDASQLRPAFRREIKSAGHRSRPRSKSRRRRRLKSAPSLAMARNKSTKLSRLSSPLQNRSTRLICAAGMLAKLLRGSSHAALSPKSATKRTRSSRSQTASSNGALQNRR